MNKTRLYTGVASFAVGAAIWAMPVVSHAATCENNNTGSMSVNTCTNTRSRNVGATRVNSRTLSKLLLSTTFTGDNHANQNTGDGTTGSGMATTRGFVTNLVTDGGLHVMAAPVSILNGENHITGSDSTNIVNISDALTAGITTVTTTDVNTTAIVDHNTGGNTANQNTGDGTAGSGDSTVDLDVVNSVIEGPVMVEL